jgi:hypothetical protein
LAEAASRLTACDEQVDSPKAGIQEPEIHIASFRGSIRILSLALPILLTVAASASSQTFGRWWWQGQIGLEQWTTENLSGGTRLSKSDRLGLRIAGSLNGFVVHPTIAAFRLDLDATLANLEGGALSESDALGGGLDLRFLPKSNYPLRLGFRRRNFDYAVPEEDDPEILFSRPENSTQWLAQWSVRKGLLNGLLLKFDRTTNEFLDPEARDGLHDSQLIKWGRTTGRVRHQIRIQRNRDIYGITDFDRENLAIYIDERNVKGKVWTWMVNGSGFRSRFFTGGREQQMDQLRLFGKTFRHVRGSDRVELDVDADSVQIDAEGPTRRFSLTGLYRWHPAARLQVVPFARYVGQEIQDGSLRSPRLGVSVIWNWVRPKFSSVFAFTSNFGQINRSGATEGGDESSTSFTVTETLVHGDQKRLRKELELNLTRDELNLTLEQPLDPSDPLDLRFVRGVGLQDSARVRTKLERQWGPRTSSLWIDWVRTESTGDLQPIPFTSESYTGNLQYSQSRVNLVATFGKTSLDRVDADDQNVQFARLWVSWQPWRYLRLNAFYRANQQAVRFAPRLDGNSLEARVDVAIGLLIFEARVFETTQEFADGLPRTNRGFNWSIRRRFRGWLPIASAPKRRGTIR